MYSTILALLTVTLRQSGECAEMIRNLSELSSLQHISQTADVITSQSMSTISTFNHVKKG